MHLPFFGGTCINIKLTLKVHPNIYCCSVAKLCLTLQPHELQHARYPSPSPAPRACSNSCPLSWWCHTINSSSVTPFSSCLQSSPASGSLLVSQLFASSDQSTGASSSVSVRPVNIKDWFLLGLTSLIFLQSKEHSRTFSSTIQKHQLFNTQPSLWSNSHICTWLLEKP